jgi:hypothetical protein
MMVAMPADRDREGNVFDVSPEAQKPGGYHDEARHRCCQDQAVVAALLDDRCDQNDEGPGRTADLVAAATERRNQKSADD